MNGFLLLFCTKTTTHIDQKLRGRNRDPIVSIVKNFRIITNIKIFVYCIDTYTYVLWVSIDSRSLSLKFCMPM